MIRTRRRRFTLTIGIKGAADADAEIELTTDQQLGLVGARAISAWVQFAQSALFSS
jgi:hypothetical protein